MKKNLSLVFLSLVLSIQCYSQTTISSLRSDGVMLKNGETFFPLGYYAEGFHTLQENIYAANAMAEAGFNLMFTEHDAFATEDFAYFLDTCAAIGIYNILGFWDPSPAIHAAMNSFIPLYKNKPSLLSWGIGDDASTLGTVEQILYKNSLSKMLDPNHLTQEAFNGVVRETVKEVDMSGTEHYVVFNPTDRVDGYGSWNYLTECVAKCEASGKLPFEIAQTFIYGGTDKYSYPTPAQCDVYSYFSIVAGMKGLMFYTFKDDSSKSTVNLSHPALWDMSARVAGEIQNTLKDVLLNGNRTTTADVNNHVYFAKWRYNSEEYVIAVNVDNVNHSVSIPILGTEKTSLFGYRNNTLSISGSNLTGTLGKLDVQIYKITGVPPDAVAPSIPANLVSSSITPTGFTISWDASADNVKVVGYEVFKDGLSIGKTKINTINISGMSCETTALYTVKAFDFDGNTSNESDPISVTTASCNGDTQTPSQPSGLVATAITAKSFTLKWNKSTDDISVTSYDVYKDGAFYKTTVDTALLVTPVLNSTSYSMSVKAKDAAGRISGMSLALVVTTSEDIPPSVPENLVIEDIATDGCKLKWNKSTDNVGVAGYEVYIGAQSISKTEADSMVITGLGCGIRLFVSVVAYDQAQNRSEHSATSAFITAECTLDTLFVKQEIWTNVTGIEVAKIPVTKNPDQVKKLSTLETSCYAGENTGNRIRGYIIAPITGSYIFYISSDDNGEFWLSTTDKPANKVKTAWMPYWAGSRIWFNEPQQKSKARDLVQGQRYYFEALMKNGAGGDNLAIGWIKPGSTSIEIVGTPYIDKYTDDYSAPSIPSDLAASEVTARSFILSWLPATDNIGITSYQVYKNNLSVGFTADTFLIIKNLTPSTQYFMTLKAKDAAGYVSELSSPLLVTTDFNTGITTSGEDKLDIYPNPASSYLVIDGIDKEADIKVVNAEGKIIAGQNNVKSQVRFDVSSWRKGLYLVSIQTSKEVIVRKVIVE